MEAMSARPLAWGFAVLLLAGLTLPAETASAHCGPPCGLIPVMLSITLDRFTDLAFANESTITVKGNVEYYWDIDQDGYAYDPNKEVEMTLGFYMERVPAWIEPKVTPAKARVPVRPSDNCMDCVQPDNAQGQGQLMFRWVLPITVTLEKKRDHDASEVRQYLRSDGMYRVALFASTPESLAGNPQTGQPAGLLEGYVQKDLRLVPEPLNAPDGSRDAQQTAAGASVLAPLLALAAGLVLFRSRA